MQKKCYQVMSLPESPRGIAPLLARQTAVGPDHLDSVSWLDHVHQIIVQYDVHRAGKLTGGSLLWHLLDCYSLVVLVDGQTKLRFQRVILLILERRRERERDNSLFVL